MSAETTNAQVNKQPKQRFSSLNRVFKLVKLQMGEKFKVIKTHSLRAFIYSIILKLGLVAAFTFLLYFIITKFAQFSMFTVDENTLAVFLFIIIAISFISSLVTVFRNLYNIKDNQFLFTMPVKHSEVLVSKLIITFLSEIISSLLFSLPFIISFSLITNSYLSGLYTGVTASYVLVAIFFVIVIPIIVLLLATLVSVPLLLFKNLVNKYSVLKVIVYAVSFVLVILILNFILNIAIANFSLMGQWLQLSYKLKLAFETFANNSWVFLQLALMFAGQNVGWGILILLGTMVVLAVATYYIIKPFYFKMSLWEISKKREVTTTRDIKECKNSFWSITRKNCWLLLQDPATAISYFIPGIAMPFIVLLVDKFMNAMYLREFGYNLLFGGNIAIIVLASLLCCTYAGSAVSQEGSNYYLLKSGPVSYKLQALSKILINFVVNCFFILVSCIIAACTTELVFWQGLYAFAVGIIISLAHMMYVFSHDFIKPQVEWKDISDFKKCSAINFSLTAGVVAGLLFTIFTFKFLLIATVERTLIYLVVMSVLYFAWAFNRLRVNLICEI